MENFSFDNEFDSENDSEHFDDSDEPFFSVDELNEMLSEQKTNDETKKIYQKITGIVEENQDNIVKANELKDNINDYELENILNYDEDKRKRDFYENSIQELNNENAHQAIFNDFLKYPKISGRKNIVDTGNLIPQKIINDTKKIVEIKDEEPDQKGHHTSIEIIRNELEEIESIIVYCKCGEKTVIKFDYEANDSNEDTISTKTNINPFTVEEVKIDTNDKDNQYSI